MGCLPTTTNREVISLRHYPVAEIDMVPTIARSGPRRFSCAAGRGGQHEHQTNWTVVGLIDHDRPS